MPVAASSAPAGHDVAATLHQAVQAAEALLADAQRAVAQRVMNDGRAIARAFDREQRATHGLAWLATYVEALRQLAAYAERMHAAGSFGEIEELLVRIGARRISGADPRRHSHEPGRDRAPCRSRPRTVRRGGARDAGGRAPDRHRQHRAAPRAPRRADAPSTRTRRSATAASTRRSMRSARRCASSPTARSCRTRSNGTCATATSRSTSSRRCRSSACSA